MKYLAILIVSSATLGACAASHTGGSASSPVAPSASTPAATGHSHPEAPGQGMMGQGMMGQGMMMGAGEKGMMTDKCPMEMANTTVRTEEVEGGAAMIFSTTGDVAELRRRVAAMAEMHSKHQGGGCPMMKMHAKATQAPDADAAAPSDHAAHDHGH